MLSRLMRSLWRLLNDSSVSAIEITAFPPFVKLVFNKNELIDMLAVKSDIAVVVSKCFIRRRVFWEDLSSEYEDPVIASLDEAARELDGACAQLKSRGEKALDGVIGFVLAWGTATVTTKKCLEDKIRNIKLDKATDLFYEYSGEDRQNALDEALVALRIRVYPLLTTLIGYLSEDDPTRKEAEERLMKGLNLRTGRSAEFHLACLPVFDEAQSETSPPDT